MTPRVGESRSHRGAKRDRPKASTLLNRLEAHKKAAAALCVYGEPGVREITIGGVAIALQCSEHRIMALVRKGRMPWPARVVGGEARWVFAEIEPALLALGGTSPSRTGVD